MKVVLDHLPAQDDYYHAQDDSLAFVGGIGCQPAGSLCLMADGTWREVQDIKTGDIVLSPQNDGNYVQSAVIRTVSYIDEPIYEVRTISKRAPEILSYRCSGTHVMPIISERRWWVGKGATRKGRSIICHRDITVDEYLSKSKRFKQTSRIQTAPGYDLPPQALPLDPYVLGALLGDGCLRGKTFTFSNDERDIAIVARLRGIGALCAGGHRDKRRSSLISYAVRGHVKQALVSLGLGDKLSSEKRVPRLYLRGSLQQRLDLLAGLIDTDVTAREFSSNSKGLARDFVQLVRSVGGYAVMAARYTRCQGKRFLSYRVNFSFADHKPDCVLQRKQSPQRKPHRTSTTSQPRNHRNRSFEIVPVGQGTVYGFTLDSPSQWYVTDNHIVTHNCGKTQVAADDILRVASQYPDCGKGGKIPGIAIFSNTFQQLIDGTMGTFFERCEHWGTGYVDRIHNEHKIYVPRFRAWIGVYSIDDPDKYKSYEFSYIWIDEAQAWDKAAYDKVIGRLRGTARQRLLYPNMPLRVRITANPPWSLDHWLVDLTTKDDPETGKPPCRLITASTYDNPFLPPKYIARLRSSYDPDVAEIEMGGKFGEIGKGRIWRRFARSKHVFSEERALQCGLPPLKYDPRLPLCWSHDFNVDPLCSVLFQWRKINVPGFQREVMYVIDEMQIRHSIIEEAVKEFLNRPDAVAVAERSGLKLYGDATGNTQTNRQTGSTDFAALIQALTKAHFSGFYYEKMVGQSNPERIDRFAAGNRMLEDADGLIGVVIHERCTNLVRDLERMFYKPGTRIVELPKYKDGVPSKMLTHLADAWSYPIAQEHPVTEVHHGGVVTTQR